MFKISEKLDLFFSILKWSLRLKKLGKTVLLSSINFGTICVIDCKLSNFGFGSPVWSAELVWNSEKRKTKNQIRKLFQFVRRILSKSNFLPCSGVCKSISSTENTVQNIKQWEANNFHHAHSLTLDWQWERLLICCVVKPNLQLD